MIQISYKDRSFIVEEMTEEDREILQAEKPELYKKYFNEIKEQCNGGKQKYGGITTMKELHDNLKAHCIPADVFDMDIDHYDDFLVERRKLMAKKIRHYYASL